MYIDSQKFFINDRENYCCFWIYDQKQFKDFIGSKWWNFKKKVHNFRHNYGITERSSIGFNALNINYFKATLLPEINNQIDPDCFIEHMTNNYYDKFSELKSQNFKDIRGVCTIKINDVIYENGMIKYSIQKFTLPPRQHYSYAFCSDTKYDIELIKWIKGVNLLYHEATFMEEMKARANQTYHTTTAQAGLIATAAAVKKLIIGHFSARYKDLSPLLKEVRKEFKNAHLALEGLIFKVNE